MAELWIYRHNEVLLYGKAHSLAWTLLRILIAARFAGSPEQVQFEQGRYGKPYLKTGMPYFSLSYTQTAFIFALAEHEIGVDVEKLRIGKPHAATHCFSDAEILYLYKDKTLFDKRFYELWTQKEAYLKYTGTGLYQPPRSIDVLSRSVRKYLYTLIDDDLMISLCSRKPYRLQIYRYRIR